MAETLTANLALNINDFTNALQQASDKIAAFAQNVQQQIQKVSAAFANMSAPLQSFSRQQVEMMQIHEQFMQSSAQMTQAMNEQLKQSIRTSQQSSSESTEGIKKLKQGIIDTHEPINRMGVFLQRALSYAAGSLFASAVTGMLNVIKNFVSESVQLAIKMESIKAVFSAVAGGAAGARDTLQFLRSEAQRIGVDFLPVTESFKGFAAAIRTTSLEGEKGRQVFTAFTEAGRVLGLSGDQAKHIFIALEQMMNKGKVSAEELRRQMSNFLPGSFEIASRAIGVTTAELDKMLKSGELISEVFIPAFARRVKQELGPGLEEAMNTAAASFARLGNNIKEVSIEVGNAIVALLKPMADFINVTYDKVKQMRGDTQKERREKSALDYASEAGIDIEKLKDFQIKRLKDLYQGAQTGTLPGGIGDMLSNPSRLLDSFRGIESRKKIYQEQLDQVIAFLMHQRAINAEKDKEEAITNKVLFSQEQLEVAAKKTKQVIEEMVALTAKMRATSGSGAGTEIIPGQFRDLVLKESARFGIDPNIIARLGQRESGWNPNIQPSSAGALGLLQIMPDTGAGLGLSRGDLLDPEKNIKGGIAYLAQMLQKFKAYDDQLALALAAYNAGPGKVGSLLSQAKERGLPQTFQGISMLPGMTKETRDYVPAVLGGGPNFRGLTGDARESALKDFVTKAEELEKTLNTFPAVYDKMDAGQKKVIDNILAQATQTKALLEEEKKRPQEADRAVRDMEKWLKEKEQAAKRTQDTLEQIEGRGADDRIAILEAEFAKKRRQLVEDGAKREELARFDVATAKIVSDEKEKIEEERFDKIATIQKRFQAEFAQINTFLDTEEAKSSGKRVDIVRNEYEKRLEFLKAYAATVADQESETYKQIQSTMERLQSVERKRLEQAATRDLQEELKKQQQAYDRFAKGVENALSNAFESILTGAKNIGEAVKSFFIKLLSDLAAKAAAGIVIPIIAKIFGIGGGAPGTSAAGGLGSILGVFGGGGGAGISTGGSGGGSGILGQATGLLQQGNTISGALGGPSIGIGGSGGLFAGIANTSITSLLEGSSGLVGPATSSGSFFSGGSAASSLFGGATVGDIFTGVGTGIAVGMILSQINKLLGLSGAASSTLAGAGGGAAGGAIIGSAIAPGIGTAIGAAIGTLVGALGGYLSSLFGGGKSRLFDPRGVTAGQVGYDPTLGLHLTSPFVTEDIGYRRLGLGRDGTTGQQQTGRTIADKMDEAVNAMFTEFLKGFNALPPMFQEHLVNPLNDIALQIEAVIEKARFEGNDWGKQLETFLGTELPKAFEELTKPLQNALQKMDPVIKKFTQVVETIGKDILEFEKAKIAMRNQIGQSMVSIQTALFSPAQSFLYAQEQLAAMQARFNAGTAQERIALAPRIGDAAAQLLNLAKNPEVLGQDPQAVRNLQKQLLEQLAEVQTGTDQAYTSFQEALGTQVDLAKQQLDILVSSLSNLSSVDATVAQTLEVLNQINNALGGDIDSSGNDAQTRAQVALLGGLNNIGEAQLQELQNISAKLGSLPQFAEGTPFVQGNMLAFLHAGEAVLPSGLAHQLRSNSAYSEEASLIAHNTFAWMHGGSMRNHAFGSGGGGESQKLDITIEAEGNTPSIDAVLDRLVQKIIPEINKQVGRLDRELLISRRGR